MSSEPGGPGHRRYRGDDDPTPGEIWRLLDDVREDSREMRAMLTQQVKDRAEDRERAAVDREKLLALRADFDELERGQRTSLRTAAFALLAAVLAFAGGWALDVVTAREQIPLP